MKTYRFGPRTENIFPDKKFDFNLESYINILEKKWGKEEILFLGLDNEYTIKIMTLKPKAKCSMHFHQKKLESFILIQGELCIDLIDLRTGKLHTIILSNALDIITLEPMTPHSFCCPKEQKHDTVFLECSTKDILSDNYRFYPSKSS